MAGVKGRSGRKPKWTDDRIAQAAQDLLNWLEDPEHIWSKDWAIENHIPPEYLSRWSAKSTVFRQAVELAEMRQESRLVNGGLTKKFNARIVALVLESRHKWSSRQSVTVEREDPRQMLNEKLKYCMPEDQAEARAWLERVANGCGDDDEAEALKAAAKHEIHMQDLMKSFEGIEPAFVAR